MKAYVKWTGTFLKPMYNQDHDNVRQSKLKIGEVYEVELKKPRNILFHRKFFALLNLVFENQEVFDPNDFEAFRAYILIKCGEYVRTVTPKGEFFHAKSISFANMDEIEFDELYTKVVNLAVQEIGLTSEEIKEEINQHF